MSFSRIRMRRLRRKENIRRLVQSVDLNKGDLLYPVFVKEGIEEKVEIETMAGQYHHTLETLEKIIRECEDLGIPGVIVFGVPEKKDKAGSEAFNAKGIVQKAVGRVRGLSDLAVFTDVCLCQYTSHGHCGVLDKRGINNDETLKILKKVAVSHAEAGSDFVAPSGMMDGQVSAIREGLDEKGFENVGIMSYAAKFSSNFYGPFRAAAESAPHPPPDAPRLKDRSTYQMDFKTDEQAMREIGLDIEEGADILMVKPALPYLDMIAKADRRFEVPISAYQVSGEYASLKQAGEKDLLDGEGALLESLTSIKRAGSNFIITYAALDAARWLSGD